MPKAKTIDRLALTREKFVDRMKPAKHFNVIDYEPSEPEHREGYSTCPSCGQETLIHEDGCMHCRSCGWSAYG